MRPAAPPTTEPPPGLPRWFEACLAGAALLLLSPVLLVAGAAVRLTSPGPALFRQTRMGLGGEPFELLKLRSMRRDNRGQSFTAQGDARVTPVGRFLRRSKLDELPQLINVLRGEMSFVGPRPEVPQYVDLENPLWRRVLQSRPGLTHPLTLVLHPEETLLASVEGDSGEFYRRYFLPYKLHGYLQYTDHRTPMGDLRALLATPMEILLPQQNQPTPEEIERAVEAMEHGEAVVN